MLVFVSRSWVLCFQKSLSRAKSLRKAVSNRRISCWSLLIPNYLFLCRKRETFIPNSAHLPFLPQFRCQIQNRNYMLYLANSAQTLLVIRAASCKTTSLFWWPHFYQVLVYLGFVKFASFLAYLSLFFDHCIYLEVL